MKDTFSTSPCTHAYQHSHPSGDSTSTQVIPPDTNVPPVLRRVRGREWRSRIPQVIPKVKDMYHQYSGEYVVGSGDLTDKKEERSQIEEVEMQRKMLSKKVGGWRCRCSAM